MAGDVKARMTAQVGEEETLPTQTKKQIQYPSQRVQMDVKVVPLRYMARSAAKAVTVIQKYGGNHAEPTKNGADALEFERPPFNHICLGKTRAQR